MPRADPTRSDYCASRHLLRNLDNAKELRRNPLARAYFSDATQASRARRDAAAEGAAVERVRERVRMSLGQFAEHARHSTHVALGRMHAVLLRCEIDDRRPSDVAAELGLSERQLRRERRAAHEAFARAFHEELAAAEGLAATVCDIADLRIAAAVALHELGQDALAESAFASIAASAPDAQRRIEALCLAAEAEFDALRHDAARAHLDAARTLVVRHARELDADALRAADEHVDFGAWLLRWQTAISAGLATQPALALANAGEVRGRCEGRRALFVRACAAYAMQRYEVGDYERGGAAVRNALGVIPTLHGARTKERLALMMADAQLVALRAARGDDGVRFQAIEELAARYGHVRTMFAARSERIVSEAARVPGGVSRVADDVLGRFDTTQRRSMARAFAWAAQLVAQFEANQRRSLATAHLAESLVPVHSMVSLGMRCFRANVAIDERRFEDARAIAESAYSDAQRIGNGRLHGAAARSLAAIELGYRRRGEARRYLRESLALTGRYGSFEALGRVNALARRLDVA